MLPIILWAAEPQAGKSPDESLPAVVNVPCRDSDGRFRLRCFPTGTVVKMQAEPSPSPSHTKRSVKKPHTTRHPDAPKR